MPMDLTEHKSTLVYGMAWSHQATSHYLSHCLCYWSRCMSQYGVTRPKWVNIFCTHQKHIYHVALINCRTLCKIPIFLLKKICEWLANGIKLSLNQKHHCTKNLGSLFFIFSTIRSSRFTGIWFSEQLELCRKLSHGFQHHAKRCRESVTICRGYPAKSSLPAMLTHGR